MVRNCTASTLCSIKEEDLAAWRREQGARIIIHRGRYWEANPGGFFNGLHLMARMSAAEADGLKGLCWGYRTTLRSEDGAQGNGTMPTHLLADVDGYTLDTRPSRQRNKIRNCLKRAQIVEFLDPKPLLEEGYGVLVSARKRTGYGSPPSATEYCRRIVSYLSPGRGLILGALIDGKLGGYVAAFAVDGTAYIDNVELTTEALHTNIGTTLVFELIQACRRSGIIDEVVYGLHSREDEPLCHYKEHMGFPVVQVPTRVKFLLPFAERLVRRLRPHAYYRLTGHD